MVRPDYASPLLGPVSVKQIRLEAHYDEEYGLPSTHVMGGLTVPFYVWSYFYFYGGAGLWTVVFPLCWFVSISLSRLYLVCIL